MASGYPTFESVVERRFRLAGKAIIEEGHPYFAQVDKLEEQFRGSATPFVSFAHYDYLGLNHNAHICDAAHAAVKSHGSGVGASRLVGGERSAHHELEAEIAAFLGVGGALALISGYLTNVSLITHILGPRDLAVIDDLAHNSIVIGAKSGPFAHTTFKHNDLDDLERLLEAERSKFRNVMVFVEGLYSMDGDIPDLPRLMKLKERYDIWLMVDEAHSYGVLGRTGRGLCEHFDIDPKAIDLSIGTFSKAFVSSGGFVCSHSNAIEFLRFTLPGFVFSVGLSPTTVATAREAIRFLAEHPERVARLRNNSQLFLDLARKAGLDTGPAIGVGVIPMLFETPEQTMFVSQYLLEHGLYAPPIVQVGVPKDQPRIRFFVSAGHSEADIHRLVDTAVEAVSAWSGMTMAEAVEG